MDGVGASGSIGLPADDRPYWHRGAQPLAGFRSRTSLPAHADVVVIGAGLVGASTAYHLLDAVRSRGWRVVVIDRGDPAGEASGRNAGNFETIPEDSYGQYEGLAHERALFLRKAYPHLDREVVAVEAERQASLVLGIALRNRERFRSIVHEEGIDCDFSPRGWLFLAQNERQEQGLCDEVVLSAQHGQVVELWSRGRIKAEFGIDTEFLGRFIPGDGTYHPFKYVNGVLQAAVAGGVELYTRLPVHRVSSQGPDHHDVHTPEGTIVARRVVTATNAFTRELFPELSAIKPRQSQIMVTENAPDRCQGRLVTADEGPVYFNQPRGAARGGRAPLLMGGGDDRAMTNPSSRRRSPQVHARLLRLRDRYFPELQGQPPSAEWVGPMGFTPDQLPAIGELRPGVVVAFACNGYGGSYTTAAGEAAATLAATGVTPDWVPADVFSPVRLLQGTPLFLDEHDSLWRIATGLSKRLRAVSRHLVDALQPSGILLAPHRRRRTAAFAPSALTADDLAAVATLGRLARDDLATLLGIGRAVHLADGEHLFDQGAAGRSVFVIVRGAMDVVLTVNRRPHLVSSLGPGATLGEMSLLEGEPRSATCIARGPTSLLELGSDECQHLLDGRSPLALHLLTLLTGSLVASLRNADRALMRAVGAGGGAAGL